MIRAVLFDFGGTLFSYETMMNGESRNLLELAKDAGIEADLTEILRAQREQSRSVFKRYMARPYYRHRDMFNDSMRATLDALGGTHDDEMLDGYRARQWERHRSDFALRPGVTDTLGELRERGIHVGMVSNIDDDQLEHLLDLSGIRPCFDAILSSESARSCKPHGEIFRQALSSADCGADEALFVGDSRSADVAGANAAGLHSVLLWQRTDRSPPDEDPRPRHVISEIPQVLGLLG
ncbi:MAG: HAD family hydrolase [Deltaproteobacteria bacterium]|nr:HAD family hydrolase [Deltaproteobacteria bacterium]MBW2415049.1 HAD family hydrolase [Deltaproteobacteria bacterium]